MTCVAPPHLSRGGWHLEQGIGVSEMNGSHYLWKGAQRARRRAGWGPRLMLAEARMRQFLRGLR